MNIHFNDDGAGSPFEITPTPDRAIIGIFVDHETHYLVVLESRVDDPSDRRVYTTLLDQANGEVIPHTRREMEIAGYEEIIEQDNLRCSTTRTRTEATGNEALHSTLTDLATGKVVAESESTAFSREPYESLLTWYLMIHDEQRREKVHVAALAHQSLDERRAFWSQRLYLQMRMQGEEGLDAYAIFTPVNYEEWRGLEPEIDLILEWFIDHFPDDTEFVRSEIYQRLGRV